MVTKYRICQRYYPFSGTWYVVQKKILFWWHTYNVSFDDIKMANQFVRDIEDNKQDEICESPLEWSKKNKRFYLKYPLKTKLIKIK